MRPLVLVAVLLTFLLSIALFEDIGAPQASHVQTSSEAVSETDEQAQPQAETEEPEIERGTEENGRPD